MHYRFWGLLDSCLAAQEVAKNPWQPDLAYVVDIVETERGDVFVNEINAASTSGVYAGSRYF